MFVEFLWVLLLGSLLGLELIGKVPPTLHTPLMSGANAISGITVLAALTLIIKAGDNPALLVLGAVSLGFALFNVIGGFLVTDRMLAMFSRKPASKGEPLMSASLILKYAIELVAVLLLALGIKGLSKVRSARGANQLAAVAMALAVLGLLINYAGDGGIAATAWIWIIVGTSPAESSVPSRRSGSR